MRTPPIASTDATPGIPTITAAAASTAVDTGTQHNEAGSRPRRPRSPAGRKTLGTRPTAPDNPTPAEGQTGPDALACLVKPAS